MLPPASLLLQPAQRARRQQQRWKRRAGRSSSLSDTKARPTTPTHTCSHDQIREKRRAQLIRRIPCHISNNDEDWNANPHRESVGFRPFCDALIRPAPSFPFEDSWRNLIRIGSHTGCPAAATASSTGLHWHARVQSEFGFQPPSKIARVSAFWSHAVGSISGEGEGVQVTTTCTTSV